MKGILAEKFSLRELINSRILRWAIYLFMAVVLLVLMCDKVVMPLYTKHGREITLPNVVGMNFEDAQKLLQEQGFRVIKDKEIYASQGVEGTVLFQNPVANSNVKRGRRVYLTVNLGERWVQVPKLIGGSVRDAEFKLKRAGLNLGETHYEFSSYYPKDVVAGQSVPRSDSLCLNSKVDIVVSLGELPSHFVVPNLIGRSLDDAKIILKKAGLRPGTVEYEVQNDLLPDTVIRQSIPVGKKVNMDEIINLVVSKVEIENQEDLSESEEY